MEYGGDINIEDKEGFTPLHRAILNGSKETAKKIVKNHTKNLQMKKATKEGETYLHLAAQKGEVDLCKDLIKLNFDFLFEDFFGFSAFFYSVIYDHFPLLSWFLSLPSFPVSHLDSSGDNVKKKFYYLILIFFFNFFLIFIFLIFFLIFFF